MKQLLLAAASAALAFPALAQTTPQPAPMQPAQPAQMQPAPPMQQPPGTSVMQQPAGTTMQVMRPNLSRGQIRQIQAALNRDGFSAGRVNGIWGANTQTALQNFQTSKGIAPSGQVDLQTLAALSLSQPIRAHGEETGAIGASNPTRP